MTSLIGASGACDRSLGDVVVELRRSEARRAAGSPVASLLVGPFAAALDAWKQFAESTGRQAVIVRANAGESYSQRCLLALIQSGTLLPIVEAFIAAAERRSIEEVQRRWRAFTERDLEIVAANLAERTTRELSDACVWVIRRADRAPGSLATESLGAKPIAGAELGSEETRRRWETLGRLAAEVPPETLPAMLVVGPDELDRRDGSQSSENAATRPASAWSAWSSELAALAVAAPHWPLATTLNAAAYEAFESRAPESFAKSALRQQVLRLHGCDRETIRMLLRERLGCEAESLELVVERLTQEGATAPLVERLADSAAAQKQAHESPVEARSAQEQLLFALLNADAETAGLFQLNGAPGLPFGGQAMEVDLLCRSLKLAVEIDGYWHFHAPERYRRDRRKDVELQQHAYFVARFLAEDVATDPYQVRDLVKEIVRRRRTILNS